MSNKWSALLLRTTKKALKELAKAYEPRHRTTFGKVVSISRDSAGRPAGARVQVAYGGGQVNVAGASIFGLAKGADVELTTRGSLVAPSYQITRVLRHGIGTGSSDNAPLSTPVFAEAETLTQYVEIGEGGNVSIRTHFIIYQIQEQYVSRLNIAYQLEIRLADTGETIRLAQNQAQELVISQLVDDFTLNLQTVTLTELILSPPTIFDFPSDGGIVQIDDELIHYDYCIKGPGGYHAELTGLTRGYAGTIPANHESGTAVVCLTASVLIPDAPANTLLEARVVAVCPTDGRRSNPSDWWPFQSVYDVTPTDWSNRPFAPGVISKPHAVLIDWPDVNVEVSDFKNYLVEIKENEETQIVNAGNGSTFLWQAEPGTIIMARVAAVDTSGNQSEWSDWGRGVVVDYGPDGEEFLLNHSFENWPNDWIVSKKFDESGSTPDYNLLIEEDCNQGLFGQIARKISMIPSWQDNYYTPIMLFKLSSNEFLCQEGDVFWTAIWFNVHKFYEGSNLFILISIQLINSNLNTNKYIVCNFNSFREMELPIDIWTKLEIPFLQVGNFDKMRFHLIVIAENYPYDNIDLSGDDLKAVFSIDGAALRRVATTTNSLF